MYGVFSRFIKDKRNLVIGYCVGALAFIEMYVALFPVLKNQAAELDKLMEAYPKGFMEAFGIDSTKSMFSVLESYMSTEYFSFFWFILVIIMVVGFANSISAGEIERGTIELSLSQPISRAKLLLGRFLAGSLAVTLFTLASAYGILGSALLHNIEYQLPNYATVSFIGTLCGLAIFSMATFFSTLFSDRGKTTMATTSILLLMYAGNIISGMKDNLENIKYLSFFHYFDAPTVFGNNRVVEWSVPVFLGFISLFLFLSLVRFQRRDIAS